MKPTTARRPTFTLALFALLVLAALSTVACIPGKGDGSSATPIPETKIVDAPIEGIDILTRESFPPGYTAHITSGLPSGCARFHSARVTSRSGNTIDIEVKNTVPADRNTACTAIYGYVDTNLDLGTSFTSGQTYTVKVNDKTATFAAQ